MIDFSSTNDMFKKSRGRDTLNSLFVVKTLQKYDKNIMK